MMKHSLGVLADVDEIQTDTCVCLFFSLVQVMIVLVLILLFFVARFVLSPVFSLLILSIALAAPCFFDRHFLCFTWCRSGVRCSSNDVKHAPSSLDGTLPLLNALEQPSQLDPMPRPLFWSEAGFENLQQNIHHRHGFVARIGVLELQELDWSPLDDTGGDGHLRRSSAGSRRIVGFVDLLNKGEKIEQWIVSSLKCVGNIGNVHHQISTVPCA
mmetsp:Transcript_18765/g.44975  ORF Transcript_18765/g.44975 Transcript_18765/m.44975 type:complete len:214 (-) Transcript_18765:291-932(-)